MTLSDPSDIVSAVAQLQFLERKGVFTVPMRMKWLPGSLHGAGLPTDVRGVFDNLRGLLKINLGKISQGAELPTSASEQFYGFDHALIQLRFADEPWKQNMANELLGPLLEEIGPVTPVADEDAVVAESAARELRVPTWLKFYRALSPGEHVGDEMARDTCRLIDRLDDPASRANALAVLGFLCEQGEPDDLEPVLRCLCKAGAENPTCWNFLFEPAFVEFLAGNYATESFCQLVGGCILLVSDPAGNAVKRAGLIRRIHRQYADSEQFFETICQLAWVVRKAPGLAVEVEVLMDDKRIGDLPDLLACLCPKPRKTASPDAQFLIGRILEKSRLAAHPVFKNFCLRIVGVEFSTNLRQAIADRVLTNPKLLKSLLERKADVAQFQSRLRAAGDSFTELLWLVLISLQSYGGEQLRDITRALSLVDVAVRQSKIDLRHLDLLMGHFKRDPDTSLAALADETQIDESTGADKELSLLYLTLRIISQTAGKVDGLDLDHLSGTLRKLKVRDERGG